MGGARGRKGGRRDWGSERRGRGRRQGEGKEGKTMERIKLRSKNFCLEVVMGCVSALCQWQSVFSVVLVIILCVCGAGGSRLDSESEVEATD